MSAIATAPLDAIRAMAVRLDGADHDYDALLDASVGRQFVLLGEATHGTREFYRMRADITRRLIVEQGFDGVAVEADWPDAWHLHDYACGAHVSINDAFGAFERFPRWMWRNAEVVDFIRWLRGNNAQRSPEARVGFYGLDMYSLYRSAAEVVAYLEQVDPEQAVLAREQYAALDHVRDPQRYGYEAAVGLRPDCREAVQQRLADLLDRAPDYVDRDGSTAREAQFVAERNAHVVVSGEAYYRGMFAGRQSSWNLRDYHMTQTLFSLQEHLQRSGRPGRLVLWAHNSHLGDARATQMGRAGEWNVGQLVRRRVGARQALLVGFTTYTGHVTAASEWGGEASRMAVRPARSDSYEALFHHTRLDRCYLSLQPSAARALHEPMLERAIGVIYCPDTEYASHYFSATLAEQFDAVFHLDETEAVEPLSDDAVLSDQPAD
ncbi:MAG TPA: erythromycin esterase family protein [Dyella sp.]|nr:erythromycin esterase family protein [Dyella sp.]